MVIYGGFQQKYLIILNQKTYEKNIDFFGSITSVLLTGILFYRETHIRDWVLGWAEAPVNFYDSKIR